jgi:hypothetical protein
MSPRRIVMDEVLCQFSKLEDPRSSVNRKHPLASVIAILGVLAGASGPTGIATWAAIHAYALKKLVPLPNRGPAEGCVSETFLRQCQWAPQNRPTRSAPKPARGLL